MQMMRLRFHALFDPLLLYFLVRIANYSLLLGKPQTRQAKKTGMKLERKSGIKMNHHVSCFYNTSMRVNPCNQQPIAKSQ